MYMTASSYGIELFIWGAFASLITIPIFMGGLEFNALELVFVSIGACISIMVCTRKVNSRLVNKRLFLLTTGTLSLFLIYILSGMLYGGSKATVFKVFLKWSEIVAIAIFIFFYIDSRKRFNIIYWFLFFATFSLVAKAVFQTDFTAGHALSLPRIRIGVSTVFAIALLFPFVTRSSARILLPCLIITVILSQSRASWIAFIVVFLLFVYYAKDKQKLFRNVIVFTLLIFCSIISVPALQNITLKRISQLGVLGEKPSPSTLQRLYRLEACYYAFLDRPVLGIGAGNILNHTEKMGKAQILEWLENRNKESITPHNVYAEYLAELGVIGFTIFMSILIFIHKIIAYIRRNKKFKDDPQALGILLYFYVFLVFLAFGYITGPNRIILGSYFGLVLAMLKWPVFHLKVNNQNLNES